VRGIAIAIAIATVSAFTSVSDDAFADDFTSWMPAVAFATSGSGLIVGTLAGVASIQRARELEQVCPRYCTDAELQNALTIADASTAGFAVAGVAAIVGTVTLVLHIYADDMELSASSNGVALVGRF